MAKKNQQMGSSLPAINFTPPADPSRVTIVNAAPPDKSIYSNPVTMMDERRSPTSSQVGTLPNMNFSNQK